MPTGLEDLRTHLQRAIKNHGKDSVVVKGLRRQIEAAEAPGETGADLWVTGPLDRRQAEPE